MMLLVESVSVVLRHGFNIKKLFNIALSKNLILSGNFSNISGQKFQYLVLKSLAALFLTLAAAIFPYWKEASTNDMFTQLSPHYNQGLWTKVKKFN